MNYVILLLFSATMCVRLEYVNQNRVDILSSVDEYPRVTGVKICNKTACSVLQNYTVHERVVRSDIDMGKIVYVHLNMYNSSGEFVRDITVKAEAPIPNVFIDPTHAMMWVYVLVGLVVMGVLVSLLGYGETKNENEAEEFLNKYKFNE